MKLYITYLLIFLFAMSGCEDHLKEINTDPEIMFTTQPEFLFAGATENFMSRERHHLIQRFSGVMTLMQYLVANGGSSGSNYIVQNKEEGTSPGLSFLWNDYFTVTGRNLRQLIQLIDKNPRKDQYQGLRAIAQLLEVHQAWICLDVYGAMPYKEGLKAIMENGTLTPKYDFSWELYKDFDQIIKEQVQLLEQIDSKTQQDFAAYDFFYKGDFTKWAKFGNSLRIKMALRYEHRDEAFVKEVVNDVAATQTKVMTSNEEGCWYHHPSNFNDNIDDINAIANRYQATEAFVNTLKGMKDPRIAIMVRKNYFEPGYDDYDKMLKNAKDSLDKYNPLEERYFGMPASPYAVGKGDKEYGNRTKEEIEATWKVDDKNKTYRVRLISQLQGRLFVKNGGYKQGENDPLATWTANSSIKLSTCILSYADVCFTLAEIAEKYGITSFGNADVLYKNGIKASIEHYITLAKDAVVPTKDIEECQSKMDEYLVSNVIAYNGTREEKLEKIYTQAWINYLKHPEEAYAMWKRTGYPAFREWNGKDQVSVGYLEPIFGADSKDDASKLLIPRREVIPQRDQNYTNWERAVKGQIEKDKTYGVSSGDCRGRIWWDQKGVSY